MYGPTHPVGDPDSGTPNDDGFSRPVISVSDVSVVTGGPPPGLAAGAAACYGGSVAAAVVAAGAGGCCCTNVCPGCTQLSLMQLLLVTRD